MKIKGEGATRKVWIDGVELLPDKSQKVINHSPDGFNWGYGGSGPAQLALAILLEAAIPADANKYYQQFKLVIAAQEQDKDFEFEIDIPGWLVERKAEAKDNFNCLGTHPNENDYKVDETCIYNQDTEACDKFCAFSEECLKKTQAATPVCRDCQVCDWEEVMPLSPISPSWFGPDESLWQCKRCKRIVAFNPKRVGSRI